MEEKIEGKELDYTVKNGAIEGRIGKILAVVGNVNEKLQITTVVYKVKNLDKDSVVEALQDFASENMTMDMVKPVAAKASAKVAPVKDAPTKAKAKVAKVKEGDRDISGMKPKDAVELAKLKDVPATLKEWQKKCGGEGYCLGGSGFPVRKRFYPGHDAKLKSVLKKLGTKNAKALAKELGWADMIKWG